MTLVINAKKAAELALKARADGACPDPKIVDEILKKIEFKIWEACQEGKTFLRIDPLWMSTLHPNNYSRALEVLRENGFRTSYECGVNVIRWTPLE